MFVIVKIDLKGGVELRDEAFRDPMVFIINRLGQSRISKQY